jgi:prephenate dehydrogenase
MRTAILGAGKMGIWFAKFFLAEGNTVVIADRKKEKLRKVKHELGVETADFLEAVKNADRVLICVSINAFEEIVKRISPAVHDGQIVMDICSIKDSPVKIMHKYLKGSLILGMHPVFGPGSTTIENKTFILTPTNTQEEALAKDFKKWLETKKARVFMMSPRKHDKLMSIVLGLPHFFGLVACDTLLEEANYHETKDVAGTTYRMLFTLAEVAALENPELFVSLQLSLPELDKLERSFIEKATDWLNLIRQKDRATILWKMEKLKTKLMKASDEYDRSYKIMYKMLEAAEN